MCVCIAVRADGAERIDSEIRGTGLRKAATRGTVTATTEPQRLYCNCPVTTAVTQRARLLCMHSFHCLGPIDLLVLLPQVIKGVKKKKRQEILWGGDLCLLKCWHNHELHPVSSFLFQKVKLRRKLFVWGVVFAFVFLFRLWINTWKCWIQSSRKQCQFLSCTCLRVAEFELSISSTTCEQSEISHQGEDSHFAFFMCCFLVKGYKSLWETSCTHTHMNI